MSELALGMSIVFFLFTLITFVIKPKLNELYKKFTNSSDPNNKIHDFRFMRYKNVSPPKDLPKLPEQNYNSYGNYYQAPYNLYNYNNNYYQRKNDGIFTPTPNKNISTNNNKLNHGYNNLNLLKTRLDLTPNLNNVSKNDYTTNNKITYTPSHLEDLQCKIKNTTRKYNIASSNSNLLNNHSYYNNNVYNSNIKDTQRETGIYTNLFGERRQLNFIGAGDNKPNNIINFNTLKEREFSLPNKGNMNTFLSKNNQFNQNNNNNNTSNYIHNHNNNANISSIKNFELSTISNLSNISKISQNNKYVSKYSVDVSDIKRKII